MSLAKLQDIIGSFKKFKKIINSQKSHLARKCEEVRDLKSEITLLKQQKQLAHQVQEKSTAKIQEYETSLGRLDELKSFEAQFQGKLAKKAFKKIKAENRSQSKNTIKELKVRIACLETEVLELKEINLKQEQDFHEQQINQMPQPPKQEQLDVQEVRDRPLENDFYDKDRLKSLVEKLTNENEALVQRMEDYRHREIDGRRTINALQLKIERLQQPPKQPIQQMPPAQVNSRVKAQRPQWKILKRSSHEYDDSDTSERSSSSARHSFYSDMPSSSTKVRKLDTGTSVNDSEAQHRFNVQGYQPKRRETKSYQNQSFDSSPKFAPKSERDIRDRMSALDKKLEDLKRMKADVSLLPQSSAESGSRDSGIYPKRTALYMSMGK